MSERYTSRTIYQADAATPIGQIHLAGVINKNGSRPFEKMRVFGKYALVYLLDGRGVYFDANQYRQEVRAGDLLILFPELGHNYGPQRGDPWSEFFIVFDGPVFDLWRERGLISSERPVRRLAPVDAWSARLLALLSPPDSSDGLSRKIDICRFLALLTEAVHANEEDTGRGSLPAWLERACATLESNLTIDLDLKAVAADSGVSYETFRKRFQESLGIAPAHYRTQKRMQAACSLLEHTRLTGKEISESLGFADPFHFAKQFKRTLGVTPKEYRRQRLAPLEPS